MASPHADSFYCLTPGEFSNVQVDVYNSLCIVSSIFGLVGAAHQIRTWKERMQQMKRTESEALRRPSNATGRSGLGGSGHDGFVNPHIVVGLAKADLAACVVLIVRSVMSLSTKRPLPIPSHGNSTLSDGIKADRYKPYHWWYVIIGSPAEILLLYFYVTTFFWTFSYALSVNLKLHNRKVSDRVLSLFCWLTPLVPTAISGFVKFYPSGIECAHHDSNLYTAYMCLYVPLILVMLLNPLIYINSYKKVENLMQKRGRLTNHERQVLLAIKYKFFLIMLFFYICWTMNVIDGIYEVSTDRETPFIMIVVEAVFNPLQGLFNVLVYGRHNLLKHFLLRLTHRRLNQSLNPENGRETDRLVADTAVI